MIDGVIERFHNQEKQTFPNQLSFGKLSSSSQASAINMPLTKLSISNTAMKDVGFKYMVA